MKRIENSGSYLAMFMLFMSQGVPLVNFFNIHFVSAEILNVLVGSFGLITVAPFTVLMGGVLYRRRLCIYLLTTRRHKG